MTRTRSAFTLLEVILTMLISGLVVMAIAAAVNIHLRVVEAGRTEVEQAQLARALLRRIADDLRCAVPVAKQDSGAGSTEDLEALATAAAGASGSSGGSGSSGSGSTGGSGSSGGSSSGGSSGGASGRSGGSQGSSGSSGSSGGSSTSGKSSSSGSSSGSSNSGSSTSSSEASTATEETVVQPNFYGTQYQLQLDVGRLPDSQQFSAMTSDAALSGAAQAADTLSDVKTVAYFVGTASSPAASADPFGSTSLNAPATNGGLIRTELSRAASSFAYSQGGSSSPTNERVLAPEVVALQFQYYDGSQWITDWDSSTNQTLPLCVEVLLTLRSNAPGAATDPLSLLTATNDVVEKTYRLLVHLPGSDSTASTSTTTDSSTSETEATQ